jgi:1-acyl-sn-glycerol-3-phosphate acyltransferase
MPQDRPIDSAVPVRLLQAVNRFYVRAYHRLSVRTPCPLPRAGPAILVANHTCGLDPLLIQSVCPRLITWMMAAEYFDSKPVAAICRTVGAIPTYRSGRDTAATRAALRALGAGQILGIFPEGRIELTNQLLPFHHGVALMAIKTAVPVYPAFLDGSQRGKTMLESFLSSNNTTLTFGPPLHFHRDHSERDSFERATATIQAAVAALHPACERAAGEAR